MIAAWWPKLRESVTTRTRASAAAITLERVGGAVVGPVVDDQELVVDARERLPDPAVELGQHLALVVDRGDDAQRPQRAVTALAVGPHGGRRLPSPEGVHVWGENRFEKPV